MGTQEEAVKVKTLELYKLSHAIAIPALQRKLIKRFGKHVNQYGVKLPETIENNYVTNPKWKSKSRLLTEASLKETPKDTEKKVVVFTLPVDEIGLDTCINCQTILVPGFNLKVRIKTIDDIDFLSYECLNCNTDMRFQDIVKFPSLNKTNGNNNKSTGSSDFLKKMHEINSTSNQQGVKRGEGSNGGGGKKKRQKTSLSKMLSAKKESDSKNSGFDLFDMMKQI